MKIRKNLEKGSATMIVIFVIFFIVIILSTFLVYVTSKRNNQLRETEKLSEIYNGDMQEIYEERKNRKSGGEEIILFDTKYGRVDIVWLDTSNNIVNRPDSPSNNLGGMTPIYWDEQNKEIETTSSNNDWYEYISISGKEDNVTSKWANAKNSDGSYFVWVPRYAYRITYYSDKESNVPTGYCDARGIVDSRWECKVFFR